MRTRHEYTKSNCDISNEGQDSITISLILGIPQVTANKTIVMFTISFQHLKHVLLYMEDSFVGINNEDNYCSNIFARLTSFC